MSLIDDFEKFFGLPGHFALVPKGTASVLTPSCAACELGVIRHRVDSPCDSIPQTVLSIPFALLDLDFETTNSLGPGW